MGRDGASLAELLVSLTILAIGGGLSARVLMDATRLMEDAELGLRAALFLSELEEGIPGVEGDVRPAGPGLLIAEGVGITATVRFEPPEGATAPEKGPGGFRRSRRWSLIPDPGAP